MPYDKVCAGCGVRFQCKDHRARFHSQSCGLRCRHARGRNAPLQNILQSVNVSGECWIWHGAGTKRKQPNMRIGAKTYAVKRVVFAIFHRTPNRKEEVFSTCGNQLCVSPTHIGVRAASDRAAAIGIQLRERPKRDIHDRFWEKVAKGDESSCWTWKAGRLTFGYGAFRVNGVSMGAHVVSWELANGPVPHGMHVLHRCDNPACVNHAHLFLGTQVDNNRDRDEKGRRRCGVGERHRRAVLTEPQVLAIRANPPTSYKDALAMAKELGVTYTAVYSVITGRSWRHLLPCSRNHETQTHARNTPCEANH